MVLTAEQGARLAREGMEALRRGDATNAYALLIQLRDGAPGIPAPWLLIAQAAGQLDRTAEAEEALAHYLKGAPRHLGALLMMGAVKLKRGDERGAQSFYRTALGVAAADRSAITATMEPMLRQAEQTVTSAQQRFADHLDTVIRETGLSGGATSSRVHHALDLLFGRSELYVQQPSMLYFPGLAQRPFFERAEFAWLPAMEAATAAMRDEVSAVMASDGGFRPYVESSVDRPPAANPLRDDPSWGAFYLWQTGKPVPGNADRCPVTMEALSHAPIPVIKGRSPMAIYSLLEPGTHIQPHHGMLNTRLICHVPLIAPDGCGLRVGAETRHWQEGTALIFDDTFEHEAWNRGRETRVVLLFEIWRPDIEPNERAALTDIFEAIDTYQGATIDVG